ncbi:metal-dependent hydrolase, partial [Candidatus Woesearchaeota archaeon]|nr:metal-dependent hydrolase [Candidatus Woesearchaeota archaeon]
ETDKVLFIAFALLGSALPDIDTASSKLGSKIWPLSRLIEIFMGHRGIFHSTHYSVTKIPCICQKHYKFKK